jgi:membrane dipeptidase
VFSHSNPSALAANPRNIDDEQIRACIGRGGIIGLAPWGPLVLKPGSTRRPTLDDFIDMIDHVAALSGGTDHIGIGTDMSLGTYPEHWHDPWGEPDYPHISAEYGRVVTPDVRSPLRQVEGFDDYPQVTALADRLLARGYADADVRRMLGENYLRLFGEVWQPPRRG